VKDPSAQFDEERLKRIEQYSHNKRLLDAAKAFTEESIRHKYSYNFSWMGRPVIQYPQDLMAMQEILWDVKPDLLVETGIAHGGSLIFYASILELIGKGEVVGVDIEIRPHNRGAIESHPLFKRISMIEGSSIDEWVIQEIRKRLRDKPSVLVCLDSNHTQTHVLRELELYSPLVTKGSYMVVFDTIIEDLPEGLFCDRPWGKGNNPGTAVSKFLRSNDRFIVDKDLASKLLVTVAPGGYLRCIKD
jgi:cephalosporin hydroxylase